MPNFYAHLTYGAQVLKLLDPALRERLERERDAFDIGLYGPDPLFFYKPYLPAPARLEAMQMHHEAARPVVQRLRDAASRGVPYAASYGAGFVLHFMLDSTCHPYVLAHMKVDGPPHLAMEGEFDRYLMHRDGMDHRKHTPLRHPEMPPAFYRAAVIAYPSATPEIFQKSVQSFWRLSRLMAVTAGTPVRHVVNWSSDHIGYLSDIHGVILSKLPSGKAAKSNLALARLLQNSIQEGADQVTAFFRAVDTGCPLDSRLELDFSGRTLEVAEKTG